MLLNYSSNFSEATEAVVKKPEEKKNRFSNLFNRFKMKNHSSSTNTVNCDTPKESQSTSSKPAFNRSNSMTSDNGRGFVRNTAERHSYKAPSATSRYMQAAEAYAAKNRYENRGTNTKMTQCQPNLTNSKPNLTHSNLR